MNFNDNPQSKIFSIVNGPKPVTPADVDSYTAKPDAVQGKDVKTAFPTSPDLPGSEPKGEKLGFFARQREAIKGAVKGAVMGYVEGKVRDKMTNAAPTDRPANSLNATPSEPNNTPMTNIPAGPTATTVKPPNTQRPTANIPKMQPPKLSLPSFKR